MSFWAWRVPTRCRPVASPAEPSGRSPYRQPLKKKKKFQFELKLKLKENRATIDDEAGRCGVAAQLVVGHAGVLAFVFGVDAPDEEPCHALVALDLRRKVFAQPQQLFQ